MFLLGFSAAYVFTFLLVVWSYLNTIETQEYILFFQGALNSVVLVPLDFNGTCCVQV